MLAYCFTVLQPGDNVRPVCGISLRQGERIEVEPIVEESDDDIFSSNDAASSATESCSEQEDENMVDENKSAIADFEELEEHIHEDGIDITVARMQREEVDEVQFCVERREIGELDVMDTQMVADMSLYTIISEPYLDTPVALKASML